MLFVSDKFVQNEEVNNFNDLLSSLKQYLKTVEKEFELPDGCLFIQENYSRKNNELISWSFCIHEPYYPAPYGDNKFDKQIEQCFSFVKKELKKKGVFCIIRVNEDTLDKIAIVGNPKVLGSKDAKTVRYLVSDSALFTFMCNLIIYNVSTYHSNESSFGCCYRYLQCSDAKKCVHPNKLYSTACTYRYHLEHGHIFYGVNRNI